MIRLSRLVVCQIVDFFRHQWQPSLESVIFQVIQACVGRRGFICACRGFQTVNTASWLSLGYRFKPQGQGENCMRIVTTVWGRRLVRKAMWNYLIHELPRISQTTNTSCIFLSFLFSQKLITTPILSHIWDTKLTLICYNLEKQGTYRQQSDMLWLGETGDMQLTIIYALTCGDRGHAANNHICSDLGEQAVAVS